MKSPGPASAVNSSRSPSAARLAPHHVDHALERTMMMRAGLRIGLDRDRAGQSSGRPTRARLIAALRSMPGVCAGCSGRRMARNHAHAIRASISVGLRSLAPCTIEIGFSNLCSVYEKVDSPSSNLT